MFVLHRRFHVFCAYANRRALPDMGICMGASDEEEASLGNWQRGQAMSAHYSAHTNASRLGKMYAHKSVKLAAKAHRDNQSLETAWICSWGEVPAYVPRLTDRNAEATDKARDISAVMPTE